MIVTVGASVHLDDGAIFGTNPLVRLHSAVDEHRVLGGQQCWIKVPIDVKGLMEIEAEHLCNLARLFRHRELAPAKGAVLGNVLEQEM